MQNVFDLSSFPGPAKDTREYLSGVMQIELWDGTCDEGRPFELNLATNRLILDKRNGDLRIVDFDELKFAKLLPAGPMAIDEPPKLQAGEVVLRDDSVWTGQVQFFLEDKGDLHLLVAEEERAVRYFFPASSTKSYKVGKRLGEILVETTDLCQPDIDDALKIQKDRANQSQPPGKLGEILIEQGKISEDERQDALARRLGIPVTNLKALVPQEDALELIPENVARDHNLLPIERSNGRLVVAMLDVTNTDDLNLIGFLTGLIPEPVLATESDMQWALDSFYTSDGFEDNEPADTKEEALEPHAIIEAEAKPIVNLVRVILRQAIHQGASDIHIRPGEDNVELLYRIDGNMTFIREFRKSILPALVSRIKIMSDMDIATRRVPQDGQTRVVEDGVVIDMRISIIPTVDGESVVIRVLNTKYGPLTIEQLGFSSIQQQAFQNYLQKSHGLVLVTGPTGSGKSTTLYVALDEVLKRNLSIITLENPVEFHIPGIDQVQVNEATGLTFARVLRNVLRHDPEVIMIGEIRDEETARIAVQSSLTGHLVLSTLHTNSAVGAVSRLLDMGIEPYLIGPTLVGVVAQRLLKKNCQNCLAEDDVAPVWRRQLRLNEAETFYCGRGCEDCNDRGLKGRVGVYEFLSVTESIAEAITEGRDVSEIQKIADVEGMVSLRDNSLRLAREGTINLEQVYSIAAEF